MRPAMGVFSSRVSYRAFSGPLLKHGRRLRPLSFPVKQTKGTKEKKDENIVTSVCACALTLTGCVSIDGTRTQLASKNEVEIRKGEETIYTIATTPCVSKNTCNLLINH